MSLETQIQELTSQVGQLNKISADNAEKLDTIGGTVSKISFYLYDDNQTSGKGLVSQVRELAVRVMKLEEIEKIRKAKAGVWGAIGGAIGVGLLKLIFWLAGLMFK